MDKKTLTANVTRMFPMKSGEDQNEYQFYTDNVMGYFEGKTDYTKDWEAIKEYDGNKNRPNYAFFKKIAYQATSAGMSEFVYYHCQCGVDLSSNSNGGCPVCHAATAVMKFSKEAKKVTRCQSSCFDCSIYSEFAMGPTCKEYGTVGYETCKDRGRCKCVTCCRFEYLRKHHPDQLRKGVDTAIKALPKPLSAPARAFQEGRASIKDINGYLKKMTSPFYQREAGNETS